MSGLILLGGFCSAAGDRNAEPDRICDDHGALEVLHGRVVLQEPGASGLGDGVGYALDRLVD